MLADIKSFLLGIFTPVQILMQRIGAKEKIMTQALVDQITLIIRPGDIVLSYESQRLTSIFIKGNFDHAVIVTDKCTIMEAVGDDFYWMEERMDKVNKGGVREVPLVEWLFKKDHVAIIRPIYEDQSINKIAGFKSFMFKGKRYDYRFKIGSEEIYCSELVYLCYQEADPNFMDHVEGEILPIEYLNLTQEQPEKFQLILNTRKELQ